MAVIPAPRVDSQLAAPTAAAAGEGRLQQAFGVAAATLFLLEAVVAKAGIPGVSIPTPVHILLTALLGASLIVMAMPRERASLPMIVNLLFVVLCTLALVSSIHSERFAVFNTIFAVVWVIHFVAIWWAAPRVLSRLEYAGRAELVLLVFGAAVMVNAVFFDQARQARALGFMDNATQLGRLSALGAIVAFAVWLANRRRSWLGAILMAPALAMLVASRTRASIGAALLGLAVVLLLHARSASRVPRTRSLVIVASTVLVVLGGLYLMECGMLATDGYVEYFRLSGGVAGVFGARARIWQSGVDRLGDAGLLGGGFSEKFAGLPATRWGVEYPTYDWTQVVDPHNMLLTTALQLGIPAMVVLAALIAAITVAVMRLPVAPRAMALGVLSAGLVFGLIDGNWFITFSPTDRISMMVLALMLGCAARSSPSDGGAGEEPAPEPQDSGSSGPGASAVLG